MTCYKRSQESHISTSVGSMEKQENMPAYLFVHERIRVSLVLVDDEVLGRQTGCCGLEVVDHPCFADDAVFHFLHCEKNIHVYKWLLNDMVDIKLIV